MRALLNPIGIALLIVGLALFAGAWYAYSRRRHMADTPTSKVRSMAIGPVELNGKATAPPGAQLLHGPFTDAPCCYWEYQVEEERTRVVTSGKSTRVEHYWATVASDRWKGAIGLADDTGLVKIDPQGADLPAPAHERYGSGWGRDPPPRVLGFLETKGLSHETLFGFNKKMRFIERRLEEGTPLYVLGNATRPDGATGVGNEALVVQRDGDGAFLVSAASEKALTFRWTLAFWLMLVAGIGAASAGAWLLTGGP